LQVKERLHGKNRAPYWTEKLVSLADHSSKRERVAVEAEREFLDIQKTRLMEPHVGKSFSGVISGVTNFGFFVQLDEFFVEGLVHVTNLGNDYYVFDEDRMTLTGRRSNQVFGIGTKVKVLLAAANILKHQLDLELVGAPRSAKPTHRPPPKKHHSRHHR
jgi:ribonuclease R